MPSDSVGSLRWLEKTGGKLAWRDRLVLVAQGVRAQFQARSMAKKRETVRHMEVDSILPPDTAMCKAAEAISSQASKPYLYHHCIRAYFWARLLNGKQKFDDEAVYVALLLHDLGITDQYRLKPGEGECFTIPAARVATTLATEHQWPDKRAELVAEAITLHLNILVGARHSREAQLVRMGSGADVAGLGMYQIPKDQRNDVVSRYPRLNLKTEIDTDLKLEVRERPCSRIAFLYKNVGFGRLVQNNLFRE